MRLPAAILALAFGLIQPAPALKIVVLEGENGVNIIQQKTAVRPLIEVRDRNNVPVAGATVTFTIGGGGQSAAFAGGVQTLTVTTNAAGQAAATGMSALAPGAVQINVQAAFQGQIATAAISQTNFATAAAAAQAGAGAGTGGGASGAASGGATGSGGISGTTIGVVGGAVAAGAVAATQVGGKDDSADSNGTSTSRPSTFDVYTGPFNGQLTLNSDFTPTIGPNSLCTFISTLTGTLRLELRADGTGKGSMQGTTQQTSATSTCSLDTTPHGISISPEDTQVSGGSTPSFTKVFSGALLIETWRFSGTLSGNTITGTLSYSVAPAPGANPRYVGSTSMPVTLTKS